VEAARILNGRYRLEHVIGEGGMSVVWQAFDEILERPVAVKVLSIRLSRDAVAEERLRQEAKAIARLAHPRVASVYDFGEWTDPIGQRVPFVVMELLSGQTLNERLSSGRLPIDEAQRIGADVAAALAAAHEQGLVHRDIKPSNIMLCRSGAKVFDFGISAMVGVPEDSGIHSPIYGTPSYMAPERLTGDTVVAASDVYALGVLLYRMIADELPVQGASNTDVLAAQVTDEPAPLPPIDGLPPAVDDLILRCLAKRPEDRPSAAEAALILAAPDQAPLPAPTRPPVPPPAPAPPRRRRIRRALLLAGAAAVAVAAGLLIFSDRTDSPNAAGSRPPRASGLPVVPAGSAPASSGGPGSVPAGASGAALSSGAAGVVNPTANPTVTPGDDPPPPPVEPTPPGETGTPSADTTLSSDGGSVVARCTGSQVFVVSVQPAAGYEVKKAEQGPKPQVQISFDPVTKGPKKVTMHVSCSAGTPTTRNT
jgi:serine/threonine protein kinase